MGYGLPPRKVQYIEGPQKKKTTNLQLKGHILESDTVTRYLGVNLTNNLYWNIHIDKITQKANSTLGFLRRNLRISNTSVK